MPSSATSSYYLELLSFPTRRSSDLLEKQQIVLSSTFSKFSNFPLYFGKVIILYVPFFIFTEKILKGLKNLSRKTKSKQHTKNSKRVDRKSTRLNSSHVANSYAVLCYILILPRATLFPYTTLFRSFRKAADSPFIYFFKVLEFPPVLWKSYNPICPIFYIY